MKYVKMVFRMQLLLSSLSCKHRDIKDYCKWGATLHAYAAYCYTSHIKHYT